MEKQEFVERIFARAKSVSKDFDFDFEPELFKLISKATVSTFKRGSDNFALIFAVKSWLLHHINDSEYASEATCTALRTLAELIYAEYLHDTDMRISVEEFLAKVKVRV